MILEVWLVDGKNLGVVFFFFFFFFHFWGMAWGPAPSPKNATWIFFIVITLLVFNLGHYP